DYGGRKWSVVRGKTDRFDLAAHFGAAKGVCYAVTQVYSPTEQEVTLDLSSDGPVLAKLNGVNTFQRYEPTRGERISLRLRQGWNTLLFKLARTGEPWGFQAELIDSDGNTPEGLRLNPD